MLGIVKKAVKIVLNNRNITKGKGNTVQAGLLSEISSAVAEKLDVVVRSDEGLEDYGKYKYVKHSAISQYCAQEILYTDNLKYCSAVLVKPKVITPDSYFSFLHIENLFSRDRSELISSESVAKLMTLNDCEAYDLEYGIFCRTDWPENSSMIYNSSDNAAISGDIFRNLGVDVGHGGNLSCSNVKTDGCDVRDVGFLDNVLIQQEEELKNGSKSRG